MLILTIYERHAQLLAGFDWARLTQPITTICRLAVGWRQWMKTAKASGHRLISHLDHVIKLSKIGFHLIKHKHPPLKLTLPPKDHHYNSTSILTEKDNLNHPIAQSLIKVAKWIPYHHNFNCTKKPTQRGTQHLFSNIPPLNKVFSIEFQKVMR